MIRGSIHPWSLSFLTFLKNLNPYQWSQVFLLTTMDDPTLPLLAKTMQMTYFLFTLVWLLQFVLSREFSAIQCLRLVLQTTLHVTLERKTKSLNIRKITKISYCCFNCQRNNVINNSLQMHKTSDNNNCNNLFLCVVYNTDVLPIALVHRYILRYTYNFHTNKRTAKHFRHKTK